MILWTPSTLTWGQQILEGSLVGNLKIISLYNYLDFSHHSAFFEYIYLDILSNYLSFLHFNLESLNLFNHQSSLQTDFISVCKVKNNIKSHQKVQTKL